MKLKALSYKSPDPTKGTFKDVFIEDVSIMHKRNEKYLAIGFEMFYLNGTERVSLGETTMGFLGMENDAVSSNQTTFVSIANPNYDSLDPESKIKSIVPLFDSIGGYTFDVTTIPFEVVDFGWPTYEKVMNYFTGGTLASPEIVITEPLAVGFLTSKLVINGEVVGAQFLLL